MITKKQLLANLEKHGADSTILNLQWATKNGYGRIKTGIKIDAWTEGVSKLGLVVFTGESDGITATIYKSRGVFYTKTLKKMADVYDYIVEILTGMRK